MSFVNSGNTILPRHWATASGPETSEGCPGLSPAKSLAISQGRGPHGGATPAGGRDVAPIGSVGVGVPRHPEDVRDLIPEIALRFHGTTGSALEKSEGFPQD